MNTINRTLPWILRLAAALFAASAAQAAAAKAADPAPGFPSRPIRMIVPFAPQGPNDLLARMVGLKLTESWGQSVVVDNRPGAGTVIGTELAVRAPADGHTLLMVSLSTAVNPVLQKKLPFNTAKDLVPLINLAFSPNLLVTHPALAANNIAQLLALAKAKPGGVIFASGGSGSTTHLAAELLGLMGGVKMTHVPYKGASPATIDLLAGRVNWMFGTILPTLPHVKAGKLRALGVSSPKRTATLPDVPAIAETLPGFEAVSFYGVAAPAGVPGPVMAKLNAEMARIVNTPETREQLRLQGADAVGDSQAEFTVFFNSQMSKWARVIREAGIQAE
ncbi:MAG: tripartite tricarboxylate transporter substrate binding protein [Betaproteobacteria bacterium]|jgi:tripartite-type tricarboxylate transporter receptor subunit TctC|nr:tripartite tricarboxylate transporter substrate binding protein [Betaproteobacteria bacterium]